MSANRRKKRCSEGDESFAFASPQQPTTMHTYRPPSGVIMGSSGKITATVTATIPSAPPQRKTPLPVSPCSHTAWIDPAFLQACRDGEDDYIRHIMTSRRLTPDMSNFRDRTGKTGLSYICLNGALSLLELVLSIKSLDVNLGDNEGNTPLHFASQAGHVEVVNKLVDAFKTRLQVDARNNLGFTPLMKASLQGRTKCVKLLLAAGASPVLRDHGRGLCAYEWARYCGRQVCAEVIEKFMKNCNYSPVLALDRSRSLRKQLKDLEKSNSEPNLQFLMSTHSDQAKDGNWLKQKLKRAFTRTSCADQNNGSGGGGGRKTVEYSLMTNLSNVALCASSPLVPTATVKGSTSGSTSSANRQHLPNGPCDGRKPSDHRDPSTKTTFVLPKVQVTDVTCNRSTSSAAGDHPVATRSSQTYKSAYKASTKPSKVTADTTTTHNEILIQ